MTATMDKKTAGAQIMSETKKRAIRSLKTSSSEIFVEASIELDTSYSDLAERIGYARNSYCLWFKTGLMPAVAALACKGLMLASETAKEIDAPKHSPGTNLWVFRVPPEDAPMLARMLTGLGIEFTKFTV